MRPTVNHMNLCDDTLAPLHDYNLFSALYAAGY